MRRYCEGPRRIPLRRSARVRSLPPGRGCAGRGSIIFFFHRLYVPYFAFTIIPRQVYAGFRPSGAILMSSRLTMMTLLVCLYTPFASAQDSVPITVDNERWNLY